MKNDVILCNLIFPASNQKVVLEWLAKQNIQPLVKRDSKVFYGCLHIEFETQDINLVNKLDKKHGRGATFSKVKDTEKLPNPAFNKEANNKGDEHEKAAKINHDRLNKKAGFTPSQYQQAIFDWITCGQGDGIVEAVAGSGKTTTLVEAAKLLNTSNALFVAFNKNIIENLRPKVPKFMVVKTIHSIGHNCLYHELGETKTEQYKYGKIIKRQLSKIYERLLLFYRREIKQAKHQGKYNKKERKLPKLDEVEIIINDLVNFVQCTLTEPSDRKAMKEMVEHFGIGIKEDELEAYIPEVQAVLLKGEQLAKQDKIISFEDQLYLPHIWNLQPQRKFEWIFVDEAQDFSKAQLELVLKARAKSGRMLFVGDPRQSIYGFAGADAKSFWNIKNRINAHLMPLSICYRCPEKVIKLAREIVPQIEAKPSAPLGIVEKIVENRLPYTIQSGDLILCRMTAPLIETCIKLISKQINAKVIGQDIGDNLIKIIHDVDGMAKYDFGNFLDNLNKYRAQKVTDLNRRNNSQEQIDLFNDYCNGIMACFNEFKPKKVDELCKQIKELFSTNKSGVTLSTVHKAKGLENDRVFIIRPDLLPLKRENQQPWEKMQELNLKYVAITRAKKALFFVEANKDKETSSLNRKDNVKRRN
ncbi:MAG TPA: UvrD-helicase domain-containing protein [Leptolyngbyaceae cyanobacterium]